MGGHAAACGRSDPARILIGQVLERHCAARPEAVAVVDGAFRLTYRDLADVVEQHARALLAAGIGRGDRVAMMGPPGADFWISFLAASTVGAIWVGLNPRYRPREYAYVLEHAAPRIVFAMSPLDDRNYDLEIAGVASPDTAIVTIGTPHGRAMGLAEFLAGGETISPARLRQAAAAVTPEDVAALVYTSGTTGTPKAAMLSQGAITACAEVSERWMGDALDAVVMGAPINHVGSLCNLCMNVFFHGGRIVFLRRIDMEEFLRLGETERTTLLPLGHTVFGMLLDTPGFSLHRLRHGRLLIHGGAKTTEVMLGHFASLPARIASVYGQTETCGIVTRTVPEASVEAHASTLGQAVEGVELRLVDPTSGRQCGAGEVGELQVHCNFLFSGYYGDPRATAAAFTDDGFLKTGDLCRLRPDGNYELVDRIKLMFKSGGYNVYPSEVEQAIGEHPEVRGAVVLAMPDERYSQVGFAFVAVAPGSRLTESELREFMHARVANYKVPKRFQLCEALPTLPNLKYDRVALRRQLDDLLGPGLS